MIEPEDDFEPPASMIELVDESVSTLDGVDRGTDAVATTLSRAGRLFASLTGDVLDVRLDSMLAGPALRTPDATPSARGAGWIRFAPPLLDRYAVDRVTAWIGYAWRHALD